MDDEREDATHAAELTEEAPAAQEPQDKRPIVIVRTGDLMRETQDAWDKLDETNEPETLFAYGGLPARLRPDPVTRLLSVQPLDKPMMRYEVARRVKCCEIVRDMLVPVYPPMDVIVNLLASPRVPLPLLERAVAVPVFTPDGRLLQTPGYDEESQIYYEPEPHLVPRPVPDKPTSTHLAEARGWIDDALADFPFDGGKDGPDKAAALALMLEPFARSMIVGCCPLHLFEAPVAGTGKGLLVEVLVMPFVGTRLPVSGFPGAEDERRKRITAVIAAGSPLIFFDNVDQPIASGILSGALTTEWWEDRILRVSQMLKAKVTLTWIMSANNPVVSGEMVRRTVTCRLDAHLERPAERPAQTFRHPNLTAWAREHRRDLLWAALTLIQHWVAKGRPAPQHVPPIGRFEGWREVIGGILEACEVGGLLQNRDRLYERADETLEQWRALVVAWWRRYEQEEVSTEHLLGLITEQSLAWDWGEAQESDQGKRVSLGRALSGREGLVLEDCQIRRSQRKRHGSWFWHLTAVGEHTPERETGGD